MDQKNYDELYAENLRLKMVAPTGIKTTVYIVAIVILCMLTVAFVLGISALRPQTDNTALITTVIGIVVPVIMALLAATIQQVHLAVNSRLSQLLELTATSSKKEGAAEAVGVPNVGNQKVAG